MAWYKRTQLSKISDEITDSFEQLNVYLDQPRVTNVNEHAASLERDIESVDIPQQLAMLQNTANMIEEVKSLLKLEQKRRVIAAQLIKEEEKGAVKKMRREMRKKQVRDNSHPYPYYAIRGKQHVSVEFDPSPTPGTSQQ